MYDSNFLNIEPICKDEYFSLQLVLSIHKKEQKAKLIIFVIIFLANILLLLV